LEPQLAHRSPRFPGAAARPLIIESTPNDGREVRNSSLTTAGADEQAVDPRASFFVEYRAMYAAPVS
jgi:hypothetical protein